MYRKDSLKAKTRDKRGNMAKSSWSYKSQSNWGQFLRDSESKVELNTFLAETITAHIFPSGKLLYMTHEEHVLCNISHG